MVSQQVQEGFGQFVTIEKLEEFLDTEVEKRVALQLEKYGEILKELEKKAQPFNPEKMKIVTLKAGSTWTKPPGYDRFRVICIGGGAGGAAGHYDLWLGNSYGAHGGGGGACVERIYGVNELPPTVSYGIGANGVGRTNGGDGPGAGTAGGDTWFGTGDILLRAGGGQPGSKPTGGVLQNAPGGTATYGGTPKPQEFALYTGGYGGRIGVEGGAGTAGEAANYGGSAGGGGAGYNSGFSTTFFKPQAGGRASTLLGGAAPGKTDNGSPGRDAVINAASTTYQFYGGSGGSGGGHRKPGGKGGFPGGGGGGGGTDGKGGDGGAGCIHIIMYVEQ